MKAITLWQPWASLIADGRKLVETRPRPWHFIGPVVIHAAQHAEAAVCVQFGYDTIPTGCIVAFAWKGDCVQFPHPDYPPEETGDYRAGRWGYPLYDIHKLKTPIPAKGLQGVWEWPENDEASEYAARQIIRRACPMLSAIVEMSEKYGEKGEEKYADCNKPTDVQSKRRLCGLQSG